MDELLCISGVSVGVGTTSSFLFWVDSVVSDDDSEDSSFKDGVIARLSIADEVASSELWSSWSLVCRNIRSNLVSGRVQLDREPRCNNLLPLEALDAPYFFGLIIT